MEIIHFYLMLDKQWHNITVIDGNTLVNVNNIWLPPTTSLIAYYQLVNMRSVEGEQSDHPLLCGNLLLTSCFPHRLRKLDYTVLQEVEMNYCSYRELTGAAPMFALGFGIYPCRERCRTG